MFSDGLFKFLRIILLFYVYTTLQICKPILSCFFPTSQASQAETPKDKDAKGAKGSASASVSKPIIKPLKQKHSLQTLQAKLKEDHESLAVKMSSTHIGMNAYDLNSV